MSQSGDTGYCELIGHTRGILLTWDDDWNVISIDCEHDSCPYSKQCELYNRRPVGFHQSFPLKS